MLVDIALLKVPSSGAVSPLADDRDFYAGPAWTAYQASDPGTKTFLVRVQDDDGSIIASVPVFIVAGDRNVRYDPGALGATSGPGCRRALVGGRRGHGSALVLDPSGRDVHDVLSRLLDGIRSVVAAEGCVEAWLLFVTDATARLLVSQDGVSGPYLLAGDASIVTTEPGWDAYTESLDKKERSRVAADRRRFAASGAAVSEGTLSACVDPMVDMLVDHQARHGDVHEHDAMHRLLTAQAATCDPLSHVFLAWSPDAAVAGTLTYRDTRRVSSRAYGGREPWARAAAAYFELTYYRPIELAARWGLREVHLGIGTLRTKTLRGATVEGRWGVAIDAPGAVDSGAFTESAWEELRGETGGADHAWAPATRELIADTTRGGT